MGDDFAAVVERWLDIRGMTMKEAALAAGYSNHTMLSQVLNGHRKPNPHLALKLDQALGAGGEIIEAEKRDRARISVQELADDAAELGAWAETGTAGPGTVAAIDAEISRLIREYPSAAPGPLIARAGKARRQAGALMRPEHKHQRLTVSRDLHAAAARACAFLAVGLGDLGHRAEAAQNAATAKILADEAAAAGNPAALPIAYSALSKVAFWDGRDRDAAENAARGFEAAPVGDPVRVLLACQQADAAPVPQAREALALAVRAMDETDEPDPGLFGCTGVRLAAYTATLALREGNPSGVIAAADSSGTGGEGTPSWVQLQISAALAFLASGDADAAAERLESVLWMPDERRLATFDGKLAFVAAVASSAGFRGSRAARGLADSIAGYLGSEPPAMAYPLALGADA